jgi:hypothetical protein
MHACIHASACVHVREYAYVYANTSKLYVRIHACYMHVDIQYLTSEQARGRRTPVASVCLCTYKCMLVYIHIQTHSRTCSNRAAYHLDLHMYLCMYVYKGKYMRPTYSPERSAEMSLMMSSRHLCGCAYARMHTHAAWDILGRCCR